MTETLGNDLYMCWSDTHTCEWRQMSLLPDSSSFFLQGLQSLELYIINKGKMEPYGETSIHRS